MSRSRSRSSFPAAGRTRAARNQGTHNPAIPIRPSAPPSGANGHSPAAGFAGGPHELGQNFLVDRRVIDRLTALAAATVGPIVEFGAGDGALTLPLARSGRPITAVEIDPRRAERLARRLAGLASERPARSEGTTVVNDDALRFRLPRHPYVLLGNLPFHITTPLLRRVLADSHWTTAIVLVQWEVARRRAGVGGATLMTASWWPWYDFALESRVPARAFRPVPAVDGGILVVTRRPEPLIDARSRAAFQQFAAAVFTGRGRGLRGILRATDRGRTRQASIEAWLKHERIAADALPKSLTAAQWASLWKTWNLSTDRRLG